MTDAPLWLLSFSRSPRELRDVLEHAEECRCEVSKGTYLFASLFHYGYLKTSWLPFMRRRGKAPKGLQAICYEGCLAAVERVVGSLPRKLRVSINPPVLVARDIPLPCSDDDLPAGYLVMVQRNSFIQIGMRSQVPQSVVTTSLITLGWRKNPRRRCNLFGDEVEFGELVPS